MTIAAWLLIVVPVLLFAYAYAGYPVLVWFLSRFRRSAIGNAPEDWPQVTISLPVYNEAAQIREVLETLLRVDYPRDRLRILVVSDASTDGTDEIVEQYTASGVELLRMPQRAGKTAAENAAAQQLTGDITVNTDASVRIRPDALKQLIARFSDPAIGVASGRDVSVAAGGLNDTNVAEAGYVGYEMWVRAVESRLSGIIGASGCFYAIRSHLHRAPLPAHLSRDFASALTAREHGYRSVSVDDAVCLVPRTHSLSREYKRKVRTMSRGMETLLHKRHLLNPFRYGSFAWMLWSHKICRWLVPWGALLALAGLGILSAQFWPARWLLTACLLGIAAAWVGWRRSALGSTPRIFSLLASIASAQLATMHALIKALQGDHNAAWEPTRREHQVSA